MDNEYPDLPAMTGAEMQVTREWLGLNRKWLSGHLQISERRLLRMEAEQESIPSGVVSFLDELNAHTKSVVDEQVAKYRRLVKTSDGDVLYRTWRDSTYEGEYCASWHRGVAARVADAVPQLVLTYWEREDQPVFHKPWDNNPAP